MSQLELTLSQAQDSIVIEAHTINVTILSQQMGVMLAASDLLDQNIIAAHFWDSNLIFVLNANQVCIAHHVDPSKVVIVNIFHNFEFKLI
jgi:hypothetical protein